MDSNTLINLISIIGLIVLLLFGTYFSATEMAFASVNRARLKNIAEGGGKRGKRAAQVANIYENRFDDVISTLLICNNIVAIAAATLSATLFVRLIGDWGYLFSTIVISAIVIVLTDIFPKSMSKQSPEKVILACAPFMFFLMVILRPVNKGIVKMKNRLSARFVSEEDEKTAEEEQAELEQEIIFMVEEAEKEGAIDEEDSLLITNAIEFNELTAWDIITPRVEIVSIPITADSSHISQQFLESGYSRIPVYEDSLDNIRGVIHMRDFLRHIATDTQALELQDILTPALFTVTSARVKDLLKLMKKEKSHIAIVTDEYGGTEGIVTMDDILERLVGDIWDEHDEVIQEFTDVGKNKHKILCTAYIADMFEYFHIKAESESNTVGGWIMDMLRRIPEKGDVFDFENLRVRVTKADQRRALECIVEVLEEEEEE
jgi:CBS domain containing-hemolysin-like protein